MYIGANELKDRKFIRKAFQLYEGIVGNIASTIKVKHSFLFEFFRGYNEVEYSRQEMMDSIKKGIEYYNENVIPKLDLTNSQREYLLKMFQNMRNGTIIMDAWKWNQATSGVTSGYFWEETYRKRRKKVLKLEYLEFIKKYKEQ